MTKLRLVGLDVHVETIAVAVAEPGGEVGSIGTIPNRLERLEKSLDEAISKAPEQIRPVMEALQALRGGAQLTAATIVSEMGSFSRFEPRNRMGYSGLVASEPSSGTRLKRQRLSRA